MAAAGGHLEVLQWARENGCPWNERTCTYAASGGQLEVLQRACANGCEWDGQTITWARIGGWRSFRVVELGDSERLP